MRLGRAVRRIVARGLGILIVLAAAGAAGGFAWLSTSKPLTEGRVALDGLAGPVAIERDRFGVPRIRAGTDRDAYVALGFVHAQDRLFQMDVHRRTGAGELSALFGARTLGFDRYLRTLGFRRLAESDWQVIGAEAQEALVAYADGVNGFLASHEGAWPPEYVLLRARPEPWLPVDSLVALKGLSLLLGTNQADELLRLRLSTTLPLDRVADLWPPLPGETLAPLPAPPIAPAAGAGAATDSPGGSNAWAVAGDRTTTGAPLLANDPHLGFRLPGMWYLARLEAPGLELVGATVPGLPFLIIGHNGHVAWGFTNAYIDSQDLFVERLDAADPDRVVTPAGAEPITTRDEVLRVAGGADEVLRVRATRHGPIISDVHTEAGAMMPPGHVLALAWTALQPGDTTARAALGVSRARSVAAFIAAARDFQGPHQNMVVADTAGAIGLTVPGLVPIRPTGVDGSMPAPGWTGTHDWRGFAVVGAQPGWIDPADGMIVTANTRVVGADFVPPLARDWPPRFRADRIAALIEAAPRHDVAGMIAMQRDVTSLAARALLPALRVIAPSDETGRRAHALLDGWDGAMAADRPEPLIFAAWLVEAWRRIVADELGAAYDALRAPDPVLLAAILGGERRAWCDDVATGPVEDCLAISNAAFDHAIARLAAVHGADPAAWRWREVHRARHAHPVFGRLPWIGGLFTIDQPIGGDRFTINVSSLGWSDDPFESSFGAGYRAVYDLADLANSRFVIAVGQSGNPFSPHYDDLADRWLANEPITIAPEAEGPVERLDLEPES